MAMSVNARLRQLQRIVDCDPRIVLQRDGIDAVNRTIIAFQKRHAEAHFVIEQLRDAVSEQQCQLAVLTKAIRSTRR